MKLRFPEGFMLGVSSASTQIEGGEVGSNWNDWYHKGHIKDGSDPAVANDHWNRWREDSDLMAAMGLHVCRLGLEWARLMPKRGEVSVEAVRHYREELSYLRDLGIRPLVTLHHFSNPMWFEEKGAFEKRENLKDFLDFVRMCADRFGDLVDDWITINEPNVYATNGYCFGAWPPGRKSYTQTFRVMENMAYCHIRAYEILHETRKKLGYADTMVGFANHVRVFDPKEPKNPLHRFFAKTGEWLFQGALTQAMGRGEFRFPFRNHWHIKPGEYCDFNGVNYYTRSTVSGLADGVRENSPRNDLDWEIYPEGLVRCAEKLQAILPRPLWVTENGTCDQNDRFRAKYIYEHLQAICTSGLPFERYYHWCFCDNFEWIEGNTARFGLIHIDYETQKRTPKRSAEFYRDMAQNGGVTEECFEKYVAGEEYDIR